MLWLFERLPAALALLFGLVVGSFLNVCIYRIPLGISVAKGRSFCPACGEKIAWYDNVPLLSFFVLRGRCRRCGDRISPRYPAVEAANALLWLLCYLSHGYSAKTLLLCLALSALLVAAMIDRDTGIIPDRISVFLAALACALGGGADIRAAEALGNLGASVTIAKLGETGTASRAELMRAFEDCCGGI